MFNPPKKPMFKAPVAAASSGSGSAKETNSLLAFSSGEESYKVSLLLRSEVGAASLTLTLQEAELKLTEPALTGETEER